MNPGHLRDEVILQQISRVAGPTGTVDSYTTIGKMNCLVKPLEANIQILWMAQDVLITHLVVFRSEAADLIYMAEQLLWVKKGQLYTLKMRSGVIEYDAASSPLSYVKVEQEQQPIG